MMDKGKMISHDVKSTLNKSGQLIVTLLTQRTELQLLKVGEQI
jgi:hypothetical protein